MASHRRSRGAGSSCTHPGHHANVEPPSRLAQRARTGLGAQETADRPQRRGRPTLSCLAGSPAGEPGQRMNVCATVHANLRSIAAIAKGQCGTPLPNRSHTATSSAIAAGRTGELRFDATQTSPVELTSSCLRPSAGRGGGLARRVPVSSRPGVVLTGLGVKSARGVKLLAAKRSGRLAQTFPGEGRGGAGGWKHVAVEGDGRNAQERARKTTGDRQGKECSSNAN